MVFVRFSVVGVQPSMQRTIALTSLRKGQHLLS